MAPFLTLAAFTYVVTAGTDAQTVSWMMQSGVNFKEYKDLMLGNLSPFKFYEEQHQMIQYYNTISLITDKVSSG